MMKSSKAMRIWFLFMSMVLCLGIYLTGFSNVSWLLYVPVGVLIFAAVTGICPGQILLFKMVPEK